MLELELALGGDEIKCCGIRWGNLKNACSN